MITAISRIKSFEFIENQPSFQLEQKGTKKEIHRNDSQRTISNSSKGRKYFVL